MEVAPILAIRKFNTNKDAAFTLLEVIVSIAILAILSITGLTIFTFTTTTINRESTRSDSFYEAQDAMERLMAGEVLSQEDYTDIQWVSTEKTIEGVSGKFYILKEKNTGKIILKGFIPYE